MLTSFACKMWIMEKDVRYKYCVVCKDTAATLLTALTYAAQLPSNQGRKAHLKC